MQCQSPEKTTTPPTEMYFNAQQATYKGKALPFGKPIAEWVKVLGPYDRVYKTSVFIWDKPGIITSFKWGDKLIDNSYTNEEIEELKLTMPIDECCIFFMNLESPLGQQGKLRYARGRVSSKYVLKKRKESGWITSDEDYKLMIEEEITGKEAPENYIYPFTVYQKPINIEGALVRIGMTIESINKNREDLGLEPIRYIDANGDWKSEGGATKTKSNGYFSTFFDGYESSQPNYYHIMYYQNLGELEHIRIVHDTGQEYFRL